MPGMDATDLVDAVEADYQTELSRLGSSKSIYADTGGDLNPDRVLGAMADATHHAGATLAAWAESGDADDVFADAADRLETQYAAIPGELDGHEPGDEPVAVAEMGAADDLASRYGALVGWSLVAQRKAGQVTGYFTGQADPQTAGLVREFGEDFEAVRAAALEAIAAQSLDAAAAATAAGDVVEAAYDEYVATLEAQGVNPKPVC